MDPNGKSKASRCFTGVGEISLGGVIQFRMPASWNQSCSQQESSNQHMTNLCQHTSNATADVAYRGRGRPPKRHRMGSMTRKGAWSPYRGADWAWGFFSTEGFKGEVLKASLELEGFTHRKRGLQLAASG